MCVCTGINSKIWNILTTTITTTRTTATTTTTTTITIVIFVMVSLSIHPFILWRKEKDSRRCQAPWSGPKDFRYSGGPFAIQFSALVSVHQFNIYIIYKLQPTLLYV